MGDRFKYGELLRVTRTEILPEAGVKGRGLASVNGAILEFQTALAVKAVDDFERGRRLEEISRELSEKWQGPQARKIPEIPEKPEFSGFIEEEGVKKLMFGRRYLPLGYRKEDASIYAVDLRYTYSYLISGKNDTGKMNTLKLAMLIGARKGAKLAVVEENGEELRRITEHFQGTYISTQEELFAYFQSLIPEFKRRNQLKQKLLAEGLSEDALFERMQQEPLILICAADMAAYLRDVYTPLPNGAGMQGFVENISEKGRFHNIYFFGCIRSEDEAEQLGKKAFRCFADNMAGIHVGGNLTAQRIFNFTNIPYLQQGKPVKPGSGLVPLREDSSIAETVILPLVKGTDL